MFQTLEEKGRGYSIDSSSVRKKCPSSKRFEFFKQAGFLLLLLLSSQNRGLLTLSIYCLEVCTSSPHLLAVFESPVAKRPIQTPTVASINKLQAQCRLGDTSLQTLSGCQKEEGTRLPHRIPVPLRQDIVSSWMEQYHARIKDLNNLDAKGQILKTFCGIKKDYSSADLSSLTNSECQARLFNFFQSEPHS